MSAIGHGWIACDWPACDNETLASQAPRLGWGYAEWRDLCPTHKPDENTPPDVKALAAGDREET